MQRKQITAQATVNHKEGCIVVIDRRALPRRRLGRA